MLTPDELLVLESLVERARHPRNGNHIQVVQPVAVGDLVQLQPGADAHWQSALLLVQKVRADGGLSGPLLLPHRGGCQEAWYTFRPPELVRIGRMPFPAPGDLRRWLYCGPCPVFQGK